MSDRPLANRVAVVTGGAGLIGSAICRRLAADGAAIVVASRKAANVDAFAETLRSEGADAVGMAMNVTDEDDVQRVMADTLNHWGRIDIVVNNAGGGAGSRGHVENVALDRWNAVLALNLTGTFLCTKHAMRPMKAQGWGRFVNISSAGATGTMGMIGYAAAKSALVGFTRTIALEGAGFGVTANIVMPHLTASPRNEAQSDADKAPFLAPVPIKRFGQTSEIAAAVAYFCSPEAAYCSGEILQVTGGLQWLGATIDMG